uniref:Putative gtp-binding adp-ribosylation factor arf1 n=1 Tax=Amblyomma aureolatum TaxID=187763 RepID=A0A1E1WXH2_9ACAR
MIVCVGPKGSGKTALLKYIQQLLEGKGRRAELQVTRPTIGINMTIFKISKTKMCQVREVGGEMAPFLHQQTSDATGLIFVADSSNVFQFGETYVTLLDLLTLEHLKTVPFLLVFNKIDANQAVPLEEYKDAMRLTDVVNSAPQEVATVETSCFTGYGVDGVLDWLSRITSS